MNDLERLQRWAEMKKITAAHLKKVNQQFKEKQLKKKHLEYSGLINQQVNNFKIITKLVKLAKSLHQDKLVIRFKIQDEYINNNGQKSYTDRIQLDNNGKEIIEEQEKNIVLDMNASLHKIADRIYNAIRTPIDTDTTILSENNCRYEILTFEKVLANPKIQNYKIGEVNCVIQAILQQLQLKPEYSDRKNRSLKTILNKTISFLTLHDISLGFDAELLQKLSDHIQCKIQVFNMLGRIVLSKSSKLNVQIIKLQNSNIDHVELYYDQSQPIEMEDHEFLNKIKQLKEQNKSFSYDANQRGEITKVQHQGITYTKKSNQRLKELYAKFEKDTGIKTNSATLTISQQQFLNQFVSVNTSKNFKNLNKLTAKQFEALIKCDQKQAYTQFQQCEQYMGFPHLQYFTDMPENIDETFCIENIGFYIGNLSSSAIHPKLRTILQRLNILQQRNQQARLTSPMIKLLCKYGCKFTPTAGLYGNRFDFEFPDYMKTNIAEIGKKIYPYALYTGVCLIKSKNYFKHIYTTDRALIENLAEEYEIDELSQQNTYYCQVKDHTVSETMCHIGSYIVEYQKINMINQLMDDSLDINQIHRVVTDAFYTSQKENINLKYGFRIEENKIKFPEKEQWKGQAESYSSNNQLDSQELNNYGESFPKYRPVCKETMIQGRGGSGKTTAQLNYEGFCGSIIYVAPSNYLLDDKRKEIQLNKIGFVLKHKYQEKEELLDLHKRIKCTNYAKLLQREYTNEKGKKSKARFEYAERKNPSIIILDEISMITRKLVEEVKKLYPMANLILCGDNYQLRAWENKQKIQNTQLIEEDSDIFNPKYYGHIDKEFTTNYRCEDPKLLEILTKVIQLSDEDNFDYQIIQKLFKQFNLKFTKHLPDDYSINNIIITSTHKDGELINNMITALNLNQKKYKVKYNFTNEQKEKKYKGSFLVTGQDLSQDKRLKESYTSTCHSIQGQTVHEQIIINIANLFTQGLIYTALSRAKRLDQIRFVYITEEKIIKKQEQQEEHTIVLTPQIFENHKQENVQSKSDEQLYQQYQEMFGNCNDSDDSDYEY